MADKRKGAYARIRLSRIGAEIIEERECERGQKKEGGREERQKDGREERLREREKKKEHT